MSVWRRSARVKLTACLLVQREMNFFGKLSCSSPTQRQTTGLRRLACSPPTSGWSLPGSEPARCGSNATQAMMTAASTAGDVECKTTVVKGIESHSL